MFTRLNRFEMPKRVVKDDATANPKYARFIAEPFEIGYARTIGNSLRRVMLSSIEGLAITAVRIKGASHEFCALPSVAEDVTDIILNLKQVLLKAHGRVPPRLSLKKKGPCTVTAGDFETGNAIQVLNPTQPIATVAADGEFEMEADICVGRGFHPAEWNKGAEQEIGVIPIDSIFSPVTRVNFGVEHTRIGHRTDYEKLVLEVWTDGRVSPEEALRTGASILRHQFDVFMDYSSEEDESEEPGRQEDADRERLRKVLAMSVNEIELSVRAANCLNNANITTVGELAGKTEADMLKYRNFGKKSLNEIKDKLAELGVGLGFEIDPDLLTPPKK
ncbi:MAG: DNA-directed RNA polymerase subunit alpha [Kiritimatiellae bacterium]|nr:DNA-directed RNA polymerase subunit alpha [Kiritimatiellia bacterium]